MSWYGVLPTSGVRMLSMILAELYVMDAVLDYVGLSGASGLSFFGVPYIVVISSDVG